MVFFKKSREVQELNTHNLQNPRATTHYVILFIGRAGSSYIIDMLGSHNAIIAGQELLVEETSAEAERNRLNTLYTQSHPDIIRAVGFKTKLTDITDIAQFIRMLDEHNVKVIYLYRNNVIKQTISRINRKRLHDATNLHNLEKGVDRLPAFTIDPDEFSAWFDQTHQRWLEMHDFVHTLRRPQLRIAYEDLLTDHDAVFARIFDFLEVPHAPLQSNMIKNTQEDLRDVIENFDEIRKLYAGTEFYEQFVGQ